MVAADVAAAAAVVLVDERQNDFLSIESTSAMQRQIKTEFCDTSLVTHSSFICACNCIHLGF